MLSQLGAPPISAHGRGPTSSQTCTRGGTGQASPPTGKPNAEETKEEQEGDRQTQRDKRETYRLRETESRREGETEGRERGRETGEGDREGEGERESSMTGAGPPFPPPRSSWDWDSPQSSRTALSTAPTWRFKAALSPATSSPQTHFPQTAVYPEPRPPGRRTAARSSPEATSPEERHEPGSSGLPPPQPACRSPMGPAPLPGISQPHSVAQWLSGGTGAERSLLSDVKAAPGQAGGPVWPQHTTVSVSEVGDRKPPWCLRGWHRVSVSFAETLLRGPKAHRGCHRWTGLTRAQQVARGQGGSPWLKR